MAVINPNNTIEGAFLGLRFAGTPVSGTSGTFVGSPKGADLVDITTGIAYRNTGTAASPTWTAQA